MPKRHYTNGVVDDSENSYQSFMIALKNDEKRIKSNKIIKKEVQVIDFYFCYSAYLQYLQKYFSAIIRKL